MCRGCYDAQAIAIGETFSVAAVNTGTMMKSLESSRILMSVREFAHVDNHYTKRILNDQEGEEGKMIAAKLLSLSEGERLVAVGIYADYITKEYAHEAIRRASER